jgi:DNA-binding MarR family transcriptional regulator/GNAT superfamily N-acetyltransferase
MKSNVSDPSKDEIAAIRGFNRFYTRKLGIIEPKLFESPWTLQEARIIYEIGARQCCTATDLVRSLGLDPGFLSRTLQALQRRKIIVRKLSKSDQRVNELSLSAAGRGALEDLENRSRSTVGAVLERLDANQRAAIVHAMMTIEHTLEPPARPRPAFLLRSHRAGDIGWIISRHGAVYAQEYGWDSSFEALAADIGAQFIRSYDPSREHCWIAEIGGDPVGSIFLVKASDEIAKIRLLLVEKKARGLGIGRELTEQCIRFARQTGYKSITLWTQSILVAARGVYSAAGFRRIKEEGHQSFGVDLIGETWELEL